jgi:hypothetical protein
MKIKFPYMDEVPSAEGGAPVGGGGPAPEPAPAPAGTSMTPAGAPSEGGNFLSSLPDTWRNDLVTAAGYQGDDATKTVNYLERVSDLPTLVKNYVSAQDKIRKGELSNGLPENPSDQQLADWRQANGVPAAPADYQVALGEGMVLSDADQRILDEIYPVAHSHNIPASAIDKMVGTFLTARQRETEEIADRDNMDKSGTDRQLRETWGGDYLTNINAVRGMVELLPESTRENFMSARMADGRAIFNDPAFVMVMSDWARQLNPSATVVPNSANPVQAINDEIKQLEARMGTNEWYKDHDAQKRYQDLLTAKERMSK